MSQAPRHKGAQETTAEATLDALASALLARIVPHDQKSTAFPLGMGCHFTAYERELRLRDLDPKTRDRYAQIVRAYGRWLNRGTPTPAKGMKMQRERLQNGNAASMIHLRFLR